MTRYTVKHLRVRGVGDLWADEPPQDRLTISEDWELENATDDPENCWQPDDRSFGEGDG